jgi:hypothetical protein
MVEVVRGPCKHAGGNGDVHLCVGSHLHFVGPLRKGGYRYASQYWQKKHTKRSGGGDADPTETCTRLAKDVVALPCENPPNKAHETRIEFCLH